MITNYNEFLLESLLSESIVIYSDKFRKLINNIDSPVSKALIDIESKDIEISNNYLDINDKETISFITDRKVKEIFEKDSKLVTHDGDGGFLRHSSTNSNIFKDLDYTPDGDSTYHPNSNELGEILATTKSSSGKTYVKVKFPGGISVINNENLEYKDISRLPFLQNRQTIRIGRGIKSMFTRTEYKFKDADIEVFVNKYKSEYDELNNIFKNFELVKGKDIPKWYSSERYQYNSGTLGNSCMKSVPESYFDIYARNPDKCSMLILKNDDGDKLIGRSIIWNLDKPNVTFMDRIYTSSDSYVELFKKYAYKNGWYHKDRQDSSSDPTLVGDNGNSLYKYSTYDSELYINIEKGDSYRKFPYLDTLKYFNRDSGQLSNQEEGDIITLEDTGGGWIERECETCDGNGNVTCPECDGDGTMPCDDCYSRSARRSTGEVECDQCSGTGKEECDECNGKGKDSDGEDCENCDGDGEITCGECEGNGNVECQNCDGDTTVTCSNCDGDGNVECPDCN